MDLVTILLIAVGLSMDALAVAVGKGISVQRDRMRSALLLAFLFGGFQALMPVLGWAAGVGFQDMISEVDHWIAFSLLAIIGGKMIWDALEGEDEEDGRLSLPLALTLAVATSIDALMVGLSFAFLQDDILLPVAVIGVVTFLLSFLGFIFGSGLGRAFGGKVRIIGGVILILIGFRILLDHLQ